MMKLKNQNGTHHAVFSYNKFQVQLSGVTECLVSNIATQILISIYKFLTAKTTLPSLRIFVSPIP